MRLIAVSNTPFYDFSNYLFDGYSNPWDATYLPPKKDKMRERMIELADAIHLWTMDELSGEKVSIIVDGCKRWGYDYQGIILYPPNAYLFILWCQQKMKPELKLQYKN